LVHLKVMDCLIEVVELEVYWTAAANDKSASRLTRVIMIDIDPSKGAAVLVPSTSPEP